MSDTIEAPLAEWIDPVDLFADPYPSYERLRRETPVAWVPHLGRYFVTTFRECFDIEMDQETYSCQENEERSLMIRSMGRTLLRKDDPQHKLERNSFAPALRPKTIKTVWMSEFERTATRYLEALQVPGGEADLFRDFAVPYVADNLSTVIGFRGVDPTSMMRWSHDLIAGTGNVSEDPSIWERTRAASDEIEVAIDEAIGRLRREPDATMISAMLGSGVAEEALRANVKLTISGGMNEPSHVISGAIWALLSFPEQLRLVETGARSFADVFEETARYLSPVGMYPRVTTRDTEVGGVHIPAESTIAVVIASANRDESYFERADEFDLLREPKTNLAFGNGTHICAGNWVARAMVGAVALPRVFEQLDRLRLVEPQAVDFRGWVFRGTTSLPVRWGR